MRGFRIGRSISETLTSHSGLALIGLALNRLTDFVKEVATIPQRHGIATIDCSRSYVGLLCIGKSDFDAIENKRAVPSSGPHWETNRFRPRRASARRQRRCHFPRR